MTTHANTQPAPKSRFRKCLSVLMPAVIIGSVCTYGLAMYLVCRFAAAAQTLPSVESFWARSRPVSVEILDRRGRVLSVRGAQTAAPVKLEQLPPEMVWALTAIEDRRYYYHAGLDPYALLRAAVRNHQAGKIVQGGSTLSQQLAKNVFLTREQTTQRKMQEMLLTLWIERSFSKDEILEKYLNRVNFGGLSWGLETASQKYFNKPARELSLGESALLVGMLKAPSTYNPVNNPDQAGQRAALVLAAMEDSGHIDRARRLQALTETVTAYRKAPQNGTNYFTDWIAPQIEAVIGTPQTDITVKTTLDLNLQRWAMQAAQKNLDPARGANQLAIVTLAGDGGVHAMLGGADHTQSQFNRAVQARRPAGSAFKAFVYLAAFRAGLTPWDVRLDEPITINDWTPRNFSGRYGGPMTLEKAFASSSNAVAVALSEETGRETIIDLAARFGLTGVPDLPSAALGTKDVSPLQLTNAYLPFANWGKRAEPYGIISISTKMTNQPLYYHEAAIAEKIISTAELGHMHRIMKAAVDSGTGRRARIKGQDIGGKTGTSNGFRDAWFIGYVQDMVTGVWVGDDTNAPMQDVTGGSLPAQIWHDMMEPALEAAPRRALPVSREPLRKHSVKIHRQPDSFDRLLQKVEIALPN